MNELALFAGAGGGILGGKLLGWRTVCAVEWNPYAAAVLCARQNDGILTPFPIWDDVQTFDGNAWRGRVDVVSGGFPCQDISAAGKGAGIDGARSGMWSHMARIVGEVRPRYVLVENSPMLTSRGLGRVLGDLASLGYDARWGVLGAIDAGAPHKRERIWILANARHLQGRNWTKSSAKESTSLAGHGFDSAHSDASGARLEGHDGGEFAQGSSQRVGNDVGEMGASLANTLRAGQPRPGEHWYASDPAETREGETDHAWAERVGHIWGIECAVGRVAHGVAYRMDRLTAIGNGQVPSVAALAWRILSGE